MVVCSGFSIQFRTQNPHPVCLLKFQGEGPLNQTLAYHSKRALS